MPISNNNGFSATTISATTFYGNGANLTGVAAGSFTGGTITGPTTFTQGLTATTISATTYLGLPSSANLTFMFDSSLAGISTYSAATSIDTYVVGALATKPVSISTTPTLMGEFITPALNITYLPPSVIVSHFETQKNAGSNNYYVNYLVYKRTSGGTETLIGTSDNSSSTAVNTSVQNTLSTTITTGTTFNATDRIVVKIYGTMLSSTATVDLIYADNTNARVEIPIVIAGGTWNGGTVANASTFQSDVTFNGNIQDGNNTIDAGMMIQSSLIFLAQNT